MCRRVDRQMENGSEAPAFLNFCISSLNTEAAEYLKVGYY